MLETDDAVIRSLAACILEKPELADIPALESTLECQDPFLRQALLRVLGRTGIKAIPVLQKTLEDSDPMLRAVAAQTLADLGPEAQTTVPSLLALLEDEDLRVRFSAALALAKLGSIAVIPKLDEVVRNQEIDPRSSAMLASAIGAIGPDAIPKLREALNSDDLNIRTIAAEALSTLGVATDSGPTLKDALKDEDRRRRYATIRSLGERGGKEAAVALSEAMRADGVSPSERRYLADTIAKCGAEAIPVLEDQLQSSNAEVRELTICALAKLGKETTAAVASALEDSDVSVQAVAARELRRIGPSAIPTLIEFLQGTEAGGANDTPRLSEAQNMTAELLLHLARKAEKPVPVFTELLQDENPAVRYVAATALRQFGEKSADALPKLTALLKDDVDFVRDAARRTFVILDPAGEQKIAALDKADTSTDAPAAGSLAEQPSLAESRERARAELLKVAAARPLPPSVAPYVEEIPATGHALSFDGESYVSVPSFQYDGSHPLTVEAVVAQKVEGKSATVVADTEGGGFGLTFQNGRWHFELVAGRGLHRLPADLPAIRDVFYHVAGTFDGNLMALYVNGHKQESARKMSDSYKPSGQPLIIGASPDGKTTFDVPFQGLIHSVRISRTVRYAEDFTPPAEFKSDEDTAVLLKLDEERETVAADSSGNDHNGEIHGAEWVSLPDEEESFSKWMSGPKYQDLLETKKTEGSFPIRIQGRNAAGKSWYRSRFIPIPKNQYLDFEYSSCHGSERREYDRRREDLLLRGFCEVSSRSYKDLSGMERYCATWVRAYSSIGASPPKSTVEEIKRRGAQIPQVNYMNGQQLIPAVNWVGGFGRSEGPLNTDLELLHTGWLGLRSLTLSNGPVTNLGLEYLHGLTTLQEFSLVNTDVTDAGLMHLQWLPNLTSLALMCGPRTSTGIRTIVRTPGRFPNDKPAEPKVVRFTDAGSITSKIFRISSHSLSTSPSPVSVS